LPGLSNTPRKKRMLDYLLETRRQMIKLLVLVKWARVSKEVDQCIVLFHSHDTVGMEIDFASRMSLISFTAKRIVSTI
jgi:hypothetical protein